jgi:plastocyanin domain-containing protein
MKTKHSILLIIALIAVFGFLLIASPNLNSISTGNTVKQPPQKNTLQKGEVQEITLSMKNGNYYPQTIKVNVNQPVRIYLDNSVGGCYRDFTIRSLGIQKYLKSSNDYIEFTPTEKGTFGFACSMNMGRGTLIVE